jgi:two-component system nitrogen regulation response regulator GlnG
MKKRILLVDDEKILREIYRQAVSKDFDEVVLAENAEKALEFFQEEAFPVVITDVYMPGKSGLWLVQQIRQLSRKTQIIIITGNLDDNTGLIALKNGAYPLPKPIEPGYVRWVASLSYQRALDLC